MDGDGIKRGEISNGQVWYELDEDGVLTLGISATSVESLGEIQSVTFPSEEEHCTSGEILVEVEGHNTSLEIFAPVSGTVKEINNKLNDEPEILNEDPLEEGWLVKFELEDTNEFIENTAD